jgi:hypothetical protein
MHVCYLDYDGVLHPDAAYLGPRRTVTMGKGQPMMWAPYLVEALRPFPNVRLVLSTSWVRHLGFDRARSYLPVELRERVIGATFHRREHGATMAHEQSWLSLERGLQIRLDAQRRGLTRWIALDDAVDEFDIADRASQVVCNSDAGLSEPDTQERLAKALQALHAPQD